MSDGRKTKGKIGAKNEKAKLDKEWNKISALIDKRKSGGGGGGPAPWSAFLRGVVGSQLEALHAAAAGSSATNSKRDTRVPEEPL